MEGPDDRWHDLMTLNIFKYERGSVIVKHQMKQHLRSHWAPTCALTWHQRSSAREVWAGGHTGFKWETLALDQPITASCDLDKVISLYLSLPFCEVFLPQTAYFLIFIYLFSFGCTGSALLCAGFSLWWLLSLQSTGSRCVGFSSSGARAWLPRGMWNLPGAGIEPIYCIGRWILNHWTTRGAPGLTFLDKMS